MAKLRRAKRLDVNELFFFLSTLFECKSAKKKIREKLFVYMWSAYLFYTRDECQADICKTI